MFRLVLIFVSAGLIARHDAHEHHAHEEEICDCDGRLARIPVCGTDNFSYHNVCILKEAQKTAPKLGRRCLGQCPCPERRPPGFCTQREKGDRNNAYHMSDFDGDLTPEHIVDVIGIEHAPYGEKHLQNIIKGIIDQSFKERSLGPSLMGAVCLTNGTTVDHMKDAACVLVGKDTGLGVRCLGTCAECGVEPPCPVRKKMVRGLGV